MNRVDLNKHSEETQAGSNDFSGRADEQVASVADQDISDTVLQKVLEGEEDPGDGQKRAVDHGRISCQSGRQISNEFGQSLLAIFAPLHQGFSDDLNEGEGSVPGLGVDGLDAHDGLGDDGLDEAHVLLLLSGQGSDNVHQASDSSGLT